MIKKEEKVWKRSSWNLFQYLLDILSISQRHDVSVKVDNNTFLYNNNLKESKQKHENTKNSKL